MKPAYLLKIQMDALDHTIGTVLADGQTPEMIEALVQIQNEVRSVRKSVTNNDELWKHMR